jgi:beta-glucosidase/6-phospho-beta-glucosidase/beta-galactosidase
MGIHAPGRCSPYMGDHCLKDGGGGNTSTEPYITSHNVILAHAKAVKTYRDKYQASQGGEIGMCIASAYYEPWDPNSEDDIKAVDTKVTFEYGFYSDPLAFGKYPDIMVDYISDNRLP